MKVKGVVKEIKNNKIDKIIGYLMNNETKLYSKTTNDEKGISNKIGQRIMFNNIINALIDLKEE